MSFFFNYIAKKFIFKNDENTITININNNDHTAKSNIYFIK